MKRIVVLMLALQLCVAASAQTMPAGADAKLWEKALKIHRKAIIVDGHNDVTSPMVDEDFDLATNSVGKYHRDGDPFHTDLDRLKRSGITGEFFSIYVSGSTLASGGAMRPWTVVQAASSSGGSNPAAWRNLSR